MKNSALLLVAVILIAGCTQSGMAPIVKNLPEVKEFLNQYPEAAITASAYSPSAIKFVLKNFEEQCPNLGEEGKSYQKVTVIDGKTKQMMIVWVEAKDNTFVCAIRTSLSGEVVTTTSPPTTTAQITTTSQPTTTTPPTTATTANQTNATANTTTTTTIAQNLLPDLTVNASVVPVNSTRATFYITLKNVGQNTTGPSSFTIKYGIWNATKSIFTTQFMYNNLSAGQSYTHEWTSVYSHAPGNYYFNVSADTDNIINESIENNNNYILNYTMPFGGGTTTSSTTTTQPKPDLTSLFVSATKFNSTSVTVVYTVTNVGNADIQTQFTNTAELVDSQSTVRAQCYNQTTQLSAGQSVALSCIITYSSIQQTTYRIVTDSDVVGNIAETNEGNNYDSSLSNTYTHS